MASTFQMEKQIEPNWCWAAVSVSVGRYFFPQSTSTQCKVAGTVLSRTDCCAEPAACNQPAHLEAGLKAVNRPPNILVRALTFDEIRKQIDQQRPVCVRIAWNGGPRGHFVVISGYQLLRSGIQQINVADPFYADSSIDYNDFVFDYQGNGQWTATFLV